MTQQKKHRNRATGRRPLRILTVLAVFACCLTGISGTNRVEGLEPTTEAGLVIVEVIPVPSEMKASVPVTPAIETRKEAEANEAEDPGEADETESSDGDGEAELAEGELIEEEGSVEQDDSEEQEDIEQSLIESGYYRDDVPLSYDLQDSLHIACQEANIPYALALAVIKRETCFTNVVGDDG